MPASRLVASRRTAKQRTVLSDAVRLGILVFAGASSEGIHLVRDFAVKSIPLYSDTRGEEPQLTAAPKAEIVYQDPDTKESRFLRNPQKNVGDSNFTKNEFRNIKRRLHRLSTPRVYRRSAINPNALFPKYASTTCLESTGLDDDAGFASMNSLEKVQSMDAIIIRDSGFDAEEHDADLDAMIQTMRGSMRMSDGEEEEVEVEVVVEDEDDYESLPPQSARIMHTSNIKRVPFRGVRSVRTKAQCKDANYFLSFEGGKWQIIPKDLRAPYKQLTSVVPEEKPAYPEPCVWVYDMFGSQWLALPESRIPRPWIRSQTASVLGRCFDRVGQPFRSG